MYYNPVVSCDVFPLTGRARGRDAVPLGGGGVLLGEFKSNPFAPSNSLPLLAVTLRLRLRERPARAPRALPLPPVPFPAVAPTEPPLRPLPRLATGRGVVLSPSEEEEDSPCALLAPLLVFFDDLPSFRCCSRKSLTTCCNRLLAYGLRFRGAITPPVELTPKNSFKLPCLFSACAYWGARRLKVPLLSSTPSHTKRREGTPGYAFESSG